MVCLEEVELISPTSDSAVMAGIDKGASQGQRGLDSKA